MQRESTGMHEKKWELEQTYRWDVSGAECVLSEPMYNTRLANPAVTN